MDNYKNYRNLGLYDNLQEQFAKAFKPKDPIKYDEAELKRMTCSHIEQSTYITKNGTEEVFCKACKTFESDMPVKETDDYCTMCEGTKQTSYEWDGDYICESCYSGLADRAEAQYDSLRDEGKI